MSDRNRSGFTLIEILVTVAIMSLIMLALIATLQGTVKARDDAEVEMASVRDGPRILDMIESDLNGLHLYNVKEGMVLQGKNARPGGLRGDRIDLICSNDSNRRVRDPDRPDDDVLGSASKVNEVGYRLRISDLSGDFMELWRREDLFVDEQPFEGGTYEKIHDRITEFKVTYLDELGPEGEELDEWSMEEKQKLPAAIRISMRLQATAELVGGFVENVEELHKIFKYDRVVPLFAEQTTALSVRPYLPTKITGRNDGGGTGAGGGGAGGMSGLENGLMAGGPGGLGPGAGGFGEGGGGRGEFERRGGEQGTLIDKIGEFRDRKSFNPLDPGAIENPDIVIDNGDLSPSDEAKLDEFMNDYRNRYNSGSGGGGGGSKGGG